MMPFPRKYTFTGSEFRIQRVLQTHRAAQVSTSQVDLEAIVERHKGAKDTEMASVNAAKLAPFAQ